MKLFFTLLLDRKSDKICLTSYAPPPPPTARRQNGDNPVFRCRQNGPFLHPSFKIHLVHPFVLILQPFLYFPLLVRFIVTILKYMRITKMMGFEPITPKQQHLQPLQQLEMKAKHQMWTTIDHFHLMIRVKRLSKMARILQLGLFSLRILVGIILN